MWLINAQLQTSEFPLEETWEGVKGYWYFLYSHWWQTQLKLLFFFFNNNRDYIEGLGSRLRPGNFVLATKSNFNLN